MSTPLRIKEVYISKLYGIYNHKVTLKDEGITIIHGANGVGKTAVLKSLKYLFDWDMDALSSIPFRTMHVGLSDDTKISIARSLDENKLLSRANNGLAGPLEISFFKGANGHVETVLPVDPELYKVAEAVAETQPWLKKIQRGLWMDESNGKAVDIWDVAEKYLPPRHKKKRTRSVFFDKIRKTVNVKMIDTNRLTRRDESRQGLNVESCAADMLEKIEQVSSEYAKRSQKLDQSFPHRLIMGQHDALESGIVETRLKELESYQTWLSSMGLLATLDGPAFPSDVRTLSRGKLETISLFVQDSEMKLDAFSELANRCYILLELLREKFKHKFLMISKERGLSIVDEAGAVIPLTSLSSGEQHEIVISYELLFKTPANCLLLIDEPEISLHVKWQRSFISDLSRIAKVVGFETLIATHSPFIVGDNHHLMESLDEVGDSDDY